MTDQDEKISGLMAKALDRRKFFKGAGLTGLSLAGASLVAGKLGAFDNVPGASSFGMQPKKVGAATDYDPQILNFALNLEYLEAEFYTVATTGKTLEESGFAIHGTGKSGPTTGGKRVNFEKTPGDPHWDGVEASGKLQQVALEIANDEQQHVLLLRGALGSAAVAKPTIDLDALGIGFSSFRSFLSLARAFEDTGVSAYGGAAPLITSSAYLGVAVQIALTEAYHASNLRLLIAENKVDTFALDSADYPPPPTGKQFFETNAQGLTVVRTVSEVLAIVYHSNKKGTNHGGFFPCGVNGGFTTV